MANGALFLGFGLAYPGYQEKALKLFAWRLERYSELQKQGIIESFETVFLDYHGGDLAGFILLRGDRREVEQAANESRLGKCDATCRCGSLTLWLRGGIHRRGRQEKTNRLRKAIG